MPRRTSQRRRMGGSLRLAGGGGRADRILKFLKKANTFLRKNKLLSRGAHAYSKSNLGYAKQVGRAGEYAGRLGYGRKCARHCRRR